MARAKEWEEGKEAYENGEGHNDNPYHPLTIPGENWTDGWLAGQKEDKE